MRLMEYEGCMYNTYDVNVFCQKEDVTYSLKGYEMYSSQVFEW